MISKKELLERIDEYSEKTNEFDGIRWHEKKYMTQKGAAALKQWIESLPDDQPDLLPFQWPVKEGYEVVTRDGRKVVKIDFWDMLDMPVLFAVEEYSEPFTALPDGRTCLSRQSDIDLFLRRVEKKVWVVEWHNGAWSVSDKKPYPNPKANIYEATLKPVV